MGKLTNSLDDLSTRGMLQQTKRLKDVRVVGYHAHPHSVGCHVQGAHHVLDERHLVVEADGVHTRGAVQHEDHFGR